MVAVLLQTVEVVVLLVAVCGIKGGGVVGRIRKKVVFLCLCGCRKHCR
jgi:hypothetical protein